MSKAVIIMDIPEQYNIKDLKVDRVRFDIPFQIYKSDYITLDGGHVKSITDLPHRQIEKRYDMFSEYDQYYIDEWAIGWNDCLREIIGK